MTALDEWLKTGAHLPDVLRDFHDQKDVFKAIHETVDVEKYGQGIAQDITWVIGQCYVIDIFLWWMARRGYTLQRSRAKQEFVSLNDTLRALEARRTAVLQAVLAADAAKGGSDAE
jgi:hypothetical protein